MARFRKIDVRIWGDEKVRRLTPIPPCGQGLWHYLLFGRETGIIPGIIVSSELGLAGSLGWPPEAFRKAFREVLREGLAEADWNARLAWVPKAIKYNPPQSPNVIKAWSGAWDEVPECVLKLKSWGVLKAFVEGMGEGFLKAFTEACPKPLANQEQEQEQEQEEDLPPAAGPPQRPDLQLLGDPKPPPRRRSEAEGFWDWAQSERLKRPGLIRDRAPEQPQLNAWFARAVREVGGLERLRAAFLRFLADDYWAAKAFPFGAFTSEGVWRKHGNNPEPLRGTQMRAAAPGEEGF